MADSQFHASSPFPHLPEVMLGVLVVVLGRDLVAAQGRFARQRKVTLVALFGIAGTGWR